MNEPVNYDCRHFFRSVPNLAHAFVKLVITDRAPVILVVRTFSQFVQH